MKLPDLPVFPIPLSLYISILAVLLLTLIAAGYALSLPISLLRFSRLHGFVFLCTCARILSIALSCP
jgi:hypothetical protein